jgi:uroporphyrinogen-III synthase
LIRDSVLLTRVTENNQPIEKSLNALSLRLIHRPILKIEPIELDGSSFESLQNLDLYDHIIFISTNSVLYGMGLLASRWPQWPLKLKWYAVGESTATQLRQAGIDPQVPAEFSSEGLLALPELNQVENQRVLIIRGLGGRETLKKKLLERHAIVDYFEVYQRIENKWPEGIVSQQEATKLLACVVYSADSLASFDQQATSAVRLIPMIVPSERVKQIALSMGYASVFAVPPTDAAIVKQISMLKSDTPKYS